VAARPTSTCCCAPDAGTSCPLKNLAHGCTKSGGKSCGVGRAEPFAATLPPSARSLPTLLPEALPYRIDIAVVPLDTAPQTIASSTQRAPDPPPPKPVAHAPLLHRCLA
ncbi:MAG: hypothetical protein JWN02_1783, partial [Acidobacteria bacterium]|nr:hypothetical protein [Acidobacteriota bacterium]